MKIEVYGDRTEVAKIAAGVVARQLREKPDSVLMLPTGHTMLGMYRELVGMYEAGKVSFSETATFNLDEYLGLGARDPESFASYMHDNFFDHVDSKKTRIPNGLALDAEKECEDYEAEIAASGGIGLCLLGIGRNGHVGFNEPGTPFDSRTRVVALSDSTREANGEDFAEGIAPEKALTAGIGTILESREIVLIATGEVKAHAVAAAIEGRIGEEVPATALRDHPNCTFLLDQEAAASLNDSREKPGA